MTVKITGQVTDEDNNPLKDYYIEAFAGQYFKDDDWIGSATTNEDGKFTIDSNVSLKNKIYLVISDNRIGAVRFFTATNAVLDPRARTNNTIIKFDTIPIIDSRASYDPYRGSMWRTVKNFALVGTIVQRREIKDPDKQFHRLLRLAHSWYKYGSPVYSKARYGYPKVPRQPGERYHRHLRGYYSGDRGR